MEAYLGSGAIMADFDVFGGARGPDSVNGIALVQRLEA